MVGGCGRGVAGCTVGVPISSKVSCDHRETIHFCYLNGEGLGWGGEKEEVNEWIRDNSVY